MRKVVGILISCLLFSVTFAERPEELAREYYKHLVDENWEQLGQYYSDDALEEFHDLFGIVLEIPDESDREEIIGLLFGEEASVEDIKKMSHEEFFNAIMQGIYGLVGKVALMDYDSVDVIGGLPEHDSLMHVVSRCQLAIGIDDGDAMAVAPMSMEIMDVLSFENVNGSWKMILDPKIRALARQLQSIMEL